MPDITSTLYNMRLMDDLAAKNTFIHRLHPQVKLLTTLVYVGVVISLSRYEISRLLPLLFYPVLVFTLAEIPVWPLLKRLLWVLPLIIGIGIFNPIYDRQIVLIGSLELARGWISFLSLFLKCALTVIAALLLIATTSMHHLGAALRQLKIPRLFVLQFLLTYRYISVLAEELARMVQAYSLRAPGQKGIHWRSWGSFTGQLLLRTFDRAGRVYEAMRLRGFSGEYHSGDVVRFTLLDLSYLTGWVCFFAAAKIYDLPWLIGSWLTGVIR